MSAASTAPQQQQPLSPVLTASLTRSSYTGLYVEHRFCDVVLRVVSLAEGEQGSPPPQLFHVHRSVLCLASKFFDAFFQRQYLHQKPASEEGPQQKRRAVAETAVSSKGPEQLQDDVGACQGTGCSPALPEYTLTLQEDVSISSFEFVLQFLYHCPSLHLCWDNVLCVAAASQYLEALDLLEQCMTFLFTNTGPSRVAEVYEWASRREQGRASEVCTPSQWGGDSKARHRVPYSLSGAEN